MMTWDIAKVVPLVIARKCHPRVKLLRWKSIKEIEVQDVQKYI